MLSRLFKKQEETKVSFVGRKTQIVHDVTVFQTGTVFFDDIRCSVKTEDGSELCKGTWVEVVSEAHPHLIVKKIEGENV